MAAYSYTITTTGSDGSISKSGKVTVTGDARSGLNTPLLASTANQHKEIAFDYDAVKALFMLSDIACTVYVNDVSGGSPTATIVLAPGVPVAWALGGIAGGYPFVTPDITAFYVTVPGAVAGTLQVDVIWNGTP